MKTILKMSTLGLAMICGTGCVTNGEDFSSNTGWVQDGVTNKKSVKTKLGNPYSVGMSGGKETWTYGYYRYKLIGKSYQKEMKFYWNPDGTVNTYSFNSSFPADTSK